MPFKDPEKRRSYQREHRRLRRNGDTVSTPRQTRVPEAVRLRTAADALGLLEEQVAAVRDDPAVGTTERARTVGYLLTVALKAIEAGNLEGRIAMLEAVLKARGEGPR